VEERRVIDSGVFEDPDGVGSGERVIIRVEVVDERLEDEGTVGVGRVGGLIPREPVQAEEAINGDPVPRAAGFAANNTCGVAGRETVVDEIVLVVHMDLIVENELVVEEGAFLSVRDEADELVELGVAEADVTDIGFGV
jgi:hypothetical protein